MYGPFTSDVYQEMYDVMIKEKLIIPYQVSITKGMFKLW